MVLTMAPPRDNVLNVESFLNSRVLNRLLSEYRCFVKKLANVKGTERWLLTV